MKHNLLNNNTSKTTFSSRSFSWNKSTVSPASTKKNNTFTPEIQSQLYDNIKGCILNLDGTVNYYLNSNNWAFKEDGVTPSDLTGADGNVMVEIPRFWFKRIDVGSVYTWEITTSPRLGFSLHPAFVKDNIEVSHRYYGAYDACFWDATDGLYKSGLNLDNASNLFNATEDRLSSVAGVYPIVGLTRNEARLMATNNGAGWRQLDFALWSAVQMLYLIEYQSFFSQNILGDGNTNNTYLYSSNNQHDSPHTVAGYGNNIGNGSTTVVSGAGLSFRPGISFMKYRGIENIYGNCWNWCDGININIGTTGTVYYTNDSNFFVDDTDKNMTKITNNLCSESNYIKDILPVDFAFLAKSVVRGDSKEYLTDRYFGSDSANRILLVGGDSSNGPRAGFFSADAVDDSTKRDRGFGSRLVF
jgi:hypothetical protein